MIREPLADLEVRLAAVREATGEVWTNLLKLAGDASDAKDYPVAAAYRVAKSQIVLIFAALDAREVVDAEPADTQPPCFCCLHSGTPNTPENRARLRQTFCQGMAPCVEMTAEEILCSEG